MHTQRKVQSHRKRTNWVVHFSVVTSGVEVSLHGATSYLGQFGINVDQYALFSMSLPLGPLVVPVGGHKALLGEAESESAPGTRTKRLPCPPAPSPLGTHHSSVPLVFPFLSR